MNFDNSSTLKVTESLHEVSLSDLEVAPLYQSRAFPYREMTLEMEQRMISLFEELEIKPEFKEVFEESYKEFHLKKVPAFWWHEFVHNEQKYLFSCFGSSLATISIQGLTCEVSNSLKTSASWKEACKLLRDSPFSEDAQKKFDQILESISVDFIREIKDGKRKYNDSFFLSSFINTWQNMMKGARSDFDPFMAFFYKKATPVLARIDAKNKLENQDFDEDYFYSAQWNLVLNEKKLNRRLAISGKKEPKFRIKKIGGMLRKIRSFYDADVIKALYRNHVFSANIANWLSHEDPKVKLYRLQALNAHKVLLPWFKKLTNHESNVSDEKEFYSMQESLNNLATNQEVLVSFQSNKLNHGLHPEKGEQVLEKVFDSIQQVRSTHSSVAQLNLDYNLIISKIKDGFKSIDDGASVDQWMLDVLKECSCISLAPLAYQEELSQLLKIGFRRMKGPSSSMAALFYHGHFTLLRMVEFLIYLGLLDNNYQVKNPQEAKARLNHLVQNLNNRALNFILPFNLAHPYKANRALSLKDYFGMVSTLNAKSWSQSSWGELLTSRSLKDTFKFYFEEDVYLFIDTDFLYNALLNNFILKGLFSSLKNWDSEMHEVQSRVERESEQSKTNLNWPRILKQEDLVLNGVHFRELTCNYELSQQGEKEQHCVGGYFWNCLRGDSRIFSLEKDGITLSTLEITQRSGHGKWKISQNYAARNQKAPAIAQKASTQLIKMMNSKNKHEYINTISITDDINQKEYYEILRNLEIIKKEKTREEVRRLTEKEFPQINQIMVMFENMYHSKMRSKTPLFNQYRLE